MHGACEGDDSGDAEVEGEDGGATGSAPTGASMPSIEEGIAVLVHAIAEIADAAEGHAHGEVSEEVDEAWMEEEESPRSRWRRYVQSGQDEVSDPDEWADIHYGPATSSQVLHQGDQDQGREKLQDLHPVRLCRELFQKFLQIAVINA